MAESFFGFPTELPDVKPKFTGNGQGDIDLKIFDDEQLRSLSQADDEENIDLLNDETFGAPSLDTSWQEKPTDLSQFIGPQPGNSNTSVDPRKDRHNDHVSLNEAFFPKDPEDAEEEEIIENSILQLGLDDDQDDVDYTKKTSKAKEDISKDSWSSPPRKEDSQLSSLLDMLSPGKSIWTSPAQSSKEPTTSPMSNSSEVDVIQKLFNSSGSEKRPVSLDSIPPPPIPQNALPHKAMTLEEVEKSLVMEKNTKNSEMPQATIIERRTPSAPGPPPGFMLPMESTPSSVPWRAQHGLRTGYDRSYDRPNLTPIPGMMPNRSPMQPMPGYPPLLPHGFALTPGMGLLPSPAAFMGRTPMSAPQLRRPWRHPFPKFHHQNRGNWHDRSHHHREWNNSLSKEDEWISLPPSVLMTSKDKEFVVKIQLMQLNSSDPYLTDFYYMTYMERKLLEASMNQTGDGDEKSEEDLEKTKKILDKTNKHREERDYKPATFEGSLGKLSCSSVHHPRQLMDVSTVATEQTGKGRQVNPEGSKRRFLIFGLIEKGFEILLNLDDIERRKREALESDRHVYVDERTRRLEKVFRLLRFKLHTEDPIREEDFEVIMLILNISKGKKLMARLLKVLNQVQGESVILCIWKGIPILARKDANQELRGILLKPVLRIIENSSKEFLKKGVELMSGRISQSVLSNKFGLALCTACAQRLAFLTEEDESIAPLRADFVSRLQQIMSALPEKTKQRNQIYSDLLMLQTSLSLTST